MPAFSQRVTSGLNNGVTDHWNPAKRKVRGRVMTNLENIFNLKRLVSELNKLIYVSVFLLFRPTMKVVKRQNIFCMFCGI